MNINFWKDKNLKKDFISAYEKQNIKKINLIIEQININQTLDTNNILIKCIEDKKNLCFKYFLKINKDEKILKEAHIYIKEKGLNKIEKTLVLFSGDKKIKSKTLMSNYRKYQLLIDKDYYKILR